MAEQNPWWAWAGMVVVFSLPFVAYWLLSKRDR